PPSPLGLTWVDLKVMAGYFATSKKSALLRWASRWASPVLMVLISIEASTEEREASVVCSVRVPESPPWNPPFTLEIIMCLTLNSACECAGSRFQVVVAAGVEVVVAMVGSFQKSWMRERDSCCNKYSVWQTLLALSA